MRIKKKNIREELDANTVDDVNNMVDNAKGTMEKTGKEFDSIGIEEPYKVATDIVGGIIKASTEDDDYAIEETTRPSMTKNELVEAVNSISKSLTYPRIVIKTLKIKDLRNE